MAAQKALAASLLWLAAADSPRQRAQILLLQMTLAEKVSMLHGTNTADYTGNVAAIPRLNIPALALNDGRQGFRPQDRSTGQTAFPCELSIVATWRKEMMYAFGEAMGVEFAGKGSNIMLAPMLILARVPQGGRTFESCGEDPELAYHFAFQHISGVQSVPGVLANADDFVLNNQETARGSISAVCDQRTLFEMYYRGYKGAIDAGVLSFMCSYNRVNGTYACENNVTLGDLKRPDGLNFTGFVLSDWGGTHSTVPAALAGLDMEMPGGDYFGAALLAAVQSGDLAESVVDDKVLRVLTGMFSAGLFDLGPHPGQTQDSNVTSDAHNKLARTLSAAGTVLLRNEAALLPLSPAVTSIVVIGDDGGASPTCCGQGSGALFPPYVVTPYKGIQARAGPGVNVTYLPTPSIPQNITSWYSASRGDHFTDFQCTECYDVYQAIRNEGLAYPTQGSCTDCIELQLWWNGATSSNFVTTADVPPLGPGFSYVRPIGYILPLNYTGPQAKITLELWAGNSTPTGQPVGSHADTWTLASTASRADAQGLGYVLKASLGFLLTDPSNSPDFQAAIAAAKAADVAIICVSTPSSEGVDRASLALSATDDAMVSAISSAQPKSVVVLHNPGAVLMPWLNATGAVLSAWFPGQEMGNALADILWGDINPSGRLPVTFPLSDTDTPMQSAAQYPGINGTVQYTEKLLFGYRWWDSNGKTPLFPFGHGLSYTTFSYSGLSVVLTPPSAAGGDVMDIVATVAVNVTNTGQVLGTEIAQLYLAFPASAGEPPLVLRGFSDLELAPGEVGQAVFPLTARDTSTWDTQSYAWQMVHGQFTAAVGASSRDIRQTAPFTL